MELFPSKPLLSVSTHLPLIKTKLRRRKHEHIDKCGDQRWCYMATFGIKCKPLNEYHQYQVAKNAHKEYQLWYELAIHVQPVLEVPTM